MFNEKISTNWLLIDDLDFYDEFTIKKNDNDETRRYYSILSNLIDKQLTETVEWLDSEEAKNFFYDEIKYHKDVFDSLDELVAEHLLDAEESVNQFIKTVYNEASRKGFHDVQQKIYFTDQDQKAISLLKEYNFHLIRSVSNHVIYATRLALFRGMIAGDNIYDVSRRIADSGLTPLPGSTLSPLQRATMIARTESARIKTMASLQAYANVGVEKCKILTAEDNNVCYICLRNAYEFNEKQEVTYEKRGAERIHSLNSVQPCIPAHPNCRCSVIPYIRDGEILSPVDNPRQINLVQDDRIPMIRDSNKNPIPIVGNTPVGRSKFEEEYGAQYADLDEETKNFLKIYTGKGDSPINGYLRGRLTYDEAVGGWDGAALYHGLNLSFDRALEIKEEFLEQYGKPLEEDIILCRRENNRYMGRNGETVYQDKALLSTSIYEYAKKDTYGEEINYIKIPKGTKILYLEDISLTKKDYEVLWPPNTRLELVEDIGEQRKVWELKTQY